MTSKLQRAIPGFPVTEAEVSLISERGATWSTFKHWLLSPNPEYELGGMLDRDTPIRDPVRRLLAYVKASRANAANVDRVTYSGASGYVANGYEGNFVLVDGVPIALFQYQGYADASARPVDVIDGGAKDVVLASDGTPLEFRDSGGYVGGAAAPTAAGPAPLRDPAEPLRRGGDSGLLIVLVLVGVLVALGVGRGG
jgi:hypothetical protein